MDERSAPLQVAGELDVRTERAAEDLLDVGDRRAQIEDARLARLAPAEGEDATGQIRGSLRRLADLARILAAIRIVDGLFEELGVAGDDGKDVVEIVGDAPRELADEGEPFLLGRPGLLLALLGHFANRDQRLRIESDLR